MPETLTTIEDNDSKTLLSEDEESEITSWEIDPAEMWVRSSTKSFGGTSSWTPILNNNANYLFVSPTFSLTGTTIASLNFVNWYDLEPGYDDYGYIEISTNNGAHWQQFKSYNGTSDWVAENINLSSYCGLDNLKIRFRFYPVKLPRQYAKDGLRVRFVWEPIEDRVSPAGWGKTVKVIEIKLIDD